MQKKYKFYMEIIIQYEIFEVKQKDPAFFLRPGMPAGSSCDIMVSFFCMRERGSVPCI